MCHDVLFLKAAYDEGNTGLGGLEHAHVARPGSEQRLNFPLSSYTCQPPFWEALDSHDYGQLAVQLRCHRDLARVRAWHRCAAGRAGVPRHRTAFAGQHTRQPGAALAHSGSGEAREGKGEGALQRAAFPANAALCRCCSLATPGTQRCRGSGSSSSRSTSGSKHSSRCRRSSSRSRSSGQQRLRGKALLRCRLGEPPTSRPASSSRPQQMMQRQSSGSSRGTAGRAPRAACPLVLLPQERGLL